MDDTSKTRTTPAQPRFSHAVLLFNPRAGKGRDRQSLIKEIAEQLSPIAQKIDIEPTLSAGSAGQQARAAIEAGADLIIVCGGDGTVLDVLQGVVHTKAALAVIPLGTGNVLACDLELPFEPLAAAERLKRYLPQRIAVGKIVCNVGTPSETSRYFTVAAGVGVHSELIYNANASATKQHGGLAAYYVSGFDLLFRHKFVPFAVEITTADGTIRKEDALEMVAMRVRSFGRWLKRWRPGASLDSQHLRLVLLREKSRLAMVRYVFAALAGKTHGADYKSRSADVEFVSATRVVCTPIAEQQSAVRPIRAQADGDVLGGMPVVLEIIPDAVTMLMPPAYAGE